MKTRPPFDDYEEISLREVIAYKLRFLPSARSLGTGAAVLATGFIVVNALFLQSGTHPSAFFATRGGDHALTADERSLPAAEPTARIVFDDRAPGAQVAPQGTAVPAVSAPQPVAQTAQGASAPAQPAPATEDVLSLQQLLAELGFYDGTIDGKSGPMTRQAIADYKASVGLQGIDLTMAQLVVSARNNLPTTASITSTLPKPSPRSVVERAAEPAAAPTAVRPTPVETVTFRPPAGTVVSNADPLAGVDPDRRRVMAVQRALIRFSGEDMVVDGLAGSQTREGIRSFQNAFRMEVTGEIDAALIERMTAVGLIDG